MTDEELKAQLYKMIARTEGYPGRVAIRSLWLFEHVPAVTNQAEYDRYGRLADAIAEKAKSTVVDTMTVGWLHSQDGLLATTYDARRMEWETDADVAKSAAKRKR